MERLEASLSSIILVLQTALHSLKKEDDLGAKLVTALHDPDRLPDKRISELATTAIDLLHETQQLLEPSHIVLADHFLGYAESKCLDAAVEYRIPDLLRNGSLTINELANASQTQPSRLRKVMRVLSNNNIFTFDDARDLCSSNRVSTLLLSDHWTQWHNWVHLYGNNFYDMARGIPAACRQGTVRSPAQINFDTDKSMFQYFNEQGWLPRFHKTIGGGAIAQAPGMLEDYPWEEIKDRSFIDIGGGGGAFAASILRKHPTMQGGVLEREDVIVQARANFQASDPAGVYADVSPQVPPSQLIAGDFFTEVPASEIYTLKWTLHNWEDDRAVVILKNIRKAIERTPGSRLIIFESLLSDGRSSRLSRYADLNMWIAVNGLERTRAQWLQLAEQTGWAVHEIYKLRNAWPVAIEFRPVWRDDDPMYTCKVLNTISQVNGNLKNEVTLSPLETSSVKSVMTFIEPWKNESGHPFYRLAAIPGMKSTNFKWIDNEVVVHNARPLREFFDLDRNGFAYRDDAEGLTSDLLNALRGGNADTVKQLYYPRIESLVKRSTGASRVIIFDYTLRKRDPRRNKTDNITGKEQPATTVHCDQSGNGALRRLRQNLSEGDDLESIIKGRIQMINVWRPLNGTVIDWPLAQMDFATLRAEHVHPVDLWRGEYEARGQTVAIEQSTGQKWWYLGGHRTDEVTLLKIWDSWGHKGVANVCPHAAFRHPNTPIDAQPRESVEVRCIVLYSAD